MAQEAIGPGRSRKRVLFGLLDADGWIWASIKALFWFVVIIMLIGYIPDRAYYFTVFSTIDIGLNPQAPPASYVTPINLCPAANETLPCPAPTGAMVPWQPSPDQIALPAGRTDGTVIQVGTSLLYIGGSDGTAPVADVSISTIVDGSSFDTWKPGPALPEPRANASTLFSGGSIYVIGGTGADGAPTTTVYSLTPDPETGAFVEWKPVEDLALKEARSNTAVTAAPDGLILVGGIGPSGPVGSVLKSSFDSQGALTAWVENQPLPEARSDAAAALLGDFLWVYGGSDPAGDPTASVLRGTLTTPEPEGDAAPGALAPASLISAWASTTGTGNLPVARTNPASFVANGVMYLVGGSDGGATKGEVYWASPSGEGDIAAWENLSQTDLPEGGLAGGAAAVSGSTVFVVGGTSGETVLASSTRANLAPEKPFFQLGLLGATIPALKIEGEVGQQLGYLNAFTVGLINFGVLVIIGWAFAHKAQSTALIRRILRRG